MEKFNYEKLGEEYEEALNYIIDVVAENANQEKFNDEMYLEAYVNDFVRSKYEFLSKEEQNKVIDEVVKQYYIL